MIWRRRKLGRELRKGDAAMASGQWQNAVDAYSIVLAIQPYNAPIRKQYGHALRQLGRLDEACSAYAAAAEVATGDPDLFIHLGDALRVAGRRDDAIVSYVNALRIDPDSGEGVAGLTRLHARELIPDGFHNRARAKGLGEISAEIARLSQRLEALAQLSNYPLEAYAAFRRDIAIAAPPASPTSSRPLQIVVDAHNSIAYFVRATLLSLIDQSDCEWTAIILNGAHLADHPVASLIAIDNRISLVEAGEIGGSTEAPALHLSAGTILDRHTVGWFRFAIARTGCRWAWCDWDHGYIRGERTLLREQPFLSGMPDRDLLAQTTSPPPLVLAPKNSLIQHVSAAQQRRALLLPAVDQGQAAHIPRILATVLRVPETALDADAGNPTERWSTAPFGDPPSIGPSGIAGLSIEERIGRPAISVAPRGLIKTIQVIIPTRDAVDMLKAAIDSLLAKAAHPDQLDIWIVDNRSIEPTTKDYLDRLGRSGVAQTLVMDEPFNWSRANNLAAAKSAAPLMLFANNDVEMLSADWDVLLTGYMERGDTGVLGARLLYPDRTIQHAGILLGLGSGMPLHEGYHAASDDRGPQMRFDLTHQCSAVTGAFMAVRRTTFDAVGGFDQSRLMVAYNDIDFCLRVREAGLGVLYAPAIELVHYESKTRGINDVRSKVAWDQGEFSSLIDMWGDEAMRDPSYSPHWCRSTPFSAFRDPPMSEIIEHIDRSISATSWRTQRSGR